MSCLFVDLCEVMIIIWREEFVFILMSVFRFLVVLKVEGVEVVEVGDWEYYSCNYVGLWGFVYGVMIYYIVISGIVNIVNIVKDGYLGLFGLFCYGMIVKSGKVYLVGYGCVNYVGFGDFDVLCVVIDESEVFVDNEVIVDGNRVFYGFECENLGNGKDLWFVV